MTKWEWFFYGCLAIVGLLIVEGCSAATTIYHAHKDRVLR
jgi:hypothetical protein